MRIVWSSAEMLQTAVTSPFTFRWRHLAQEKKTWRELQKLNMFCYKPIMDQPEGQKWKDIRIIIIQYHQKGFSLGPSTFGLLRVISSMKWESFSQPSSFFMDFSFKAKNSTISQNITTQRYIVSHGKSIPLEPVLFQSKGVVFFFGGIHGIIFLG